MKTPQKPEVLTAVVGVTFAALAAFATTIKIRTATIRLLICAFLLSAGAAAFGQTIFWIGIPGTSNGTNFGASTNWATATTSNNQPVSGSLCQFNGTVAGNVIVASRDGINAAGSGNPIGGSFGANGVTIEITSSQTSPVNLISPVPTSTGMGFNGILIDPGAGQLTIGDTTANQLACTFRPSSGVHTWENDSSHPLVLMPNFQIANGGGSSGHVIHFTGTGDFAITNNLRFNNGSTFTANVQWDSFGTMYWAAGGVNNLFNNPQGGIIINSSTVIITSPGLLPFAAGQNNTVQVNGGLLKFDAPAQSDTIARTFSGAGPIEVKNGTWTFSGANNNTGSNILSGGEFIAASAENFGTSGPLGNGGTISFSGGTLGFSVNNVFDYSPRFDTAAGQAYSFDTIGQNVTFTNALGSSGGTLTKLGAGTLTLSGSSSYSGLTTVSAGKLVFQGSKTGSGNITVADNAALGVTATGTQVTPGTLTLGAGAGMTLEFNNVNSTATAPLAASTLSSAGTVTININSGTLTPGQSYPLLAWTSGSAPAVNLGVLNGFIGNLSTNGNSIKLNITATAFKWTGLSDGNWDLSTANNWQQNGGSITFANGGPALFDDSASTIAVTVNALVQPTTITVNTDTNGYTITSSGGNNIGGTAKLNKSGSSTLTLSGGANTYTGITTFNGGTVSVGALANGSSASDIGAANNSAANLVLDGGALQYTGAGVSIDRLFTLTTAGGTMDSSGSGALVLNNTAALGYSGNSARTLTLAGNLNDTNTLAAPLANNGGATALNKTGTGKWILTGNNTYSGLTTVANGTLQVGTGGGSGSLGTGNVVDNASLTFNRTGTLTVGAISGTGAVTNDGTGTVILSGNNTYAAGTTINAGTLQVGTGGATGSLDQNAGIVDNGTFVFNSTATVTLNGSISGTGNVSVLAGTLQAIGGNSYTGWTFINSGATFQPSRGQTGGLISSVVTNNGTLLFTRQDGFPLPGVFGYSNSIVGTGRVVKDNNNQNSGAVILAGTNTYSGGTWIAGGGIILGDGVTMGAGSVIGPVYFTNTTSGNLNFRVLAFNRPDDFTFTNNLISAVTDGSSAANSGALEQDGPGTVTLTGSNSYPGSTTISNSTLVVGNGGASGAIGTGAIIDSGTLVFNRSGSVAVPGNISGPGALVQRGSGTVTLTGVNTNLTGDTTVSNGTLVANSVGGVMNVAGGILAPGGLGTVGLMNVGSNMNISAGTVLVSLNKSLALSNSFVLLTNITVITNEDLTLTTNGSAGTVTYTGGTLNLGNVGPSLVVGDKFKIFSQPVSGGAGMPIVSSGFTVANNLAVDGSVTVTVVAPPPAPKINSITLSGTNVIITATNNSGPGGSYHLLGTNNLTTALSNWPVISTGSFDSNGKLALTNPVGSSLQFFILRVP